MKDEYIYIPITILVVILAYWIMPSVREWWGQLKTSEEAPEWCLVEELPPSGGSWNKNNAGHYEYQVISTQSGFKVFQQCGKLE